MDKEAIIFGFIIGLIVGVGSICAVVVGVLNGIFVE